MNDIERIHNNTQLQTELTKLLLAKMEPETCWHERETVYDEIQCTSWWMEKTYRCLHCKSKSYSNPNLFSDSINYWNSFGRLWESAQKYNWLVHIAKDNYDTLFTLLSPCRFSLEALRWFDPEGLEKAMKEREKNDK